jgi:chorismate dehydratase
MSTIRLGAVDYLNARPLVYGLEQRSDLFTLRFDVPSKCAALLHEGTIDIGMIPSIEYLRGHAPYVIVDGMGIVSEGPVASVAVFSRVPLDRITSIALDTSSRTSTGLLQVLCRESFGLDPEFVPMPPDIASMISRCDAGLLIGDPALYLDHGSLGLLKVDLGQQWTALTDLPFVWAFWAGLASAISRDARLALMHARDRGVAASDRIADAYCGAERAALGRAYLRENIQYTLDDRAVDGLRRYYELAERHGVVEAAQAPSFF